MKQKAFDNQRLTDKAYVSNLECKYVILPGNMFFLQISHFYPHARLHISCNKEKVLRMF